MFTTFEGAASGAWQIDSMAPVKGEALGAAPRLAVLQAATLLQPAAPALPVWRLTGVASYVRYVHRAERAALSAVQAGLGRIEASCAALIPIRKSPQWWELPQDERRAIFEDKSRHIAASLKYLPAIARQLYQCRDLGGPFDFLTWFEYAPGHAAMFEDLVGMLRGTEEWSFVEREVDIRLARIPAKLEPVRGEG